MLRFAVAVFIGTMGCATMAAHAAEVRSTINLSFVGLPVGRLVATTKVEGASYSYSGVLKANALVRLLAGTEVYFSANGALRGPRVVPKAHESTYRQRGKDGVLKMAFSGGRLSRVESVPEVNYKEGSIAVTRSHLRNAVDPASALVIPVNPGDVGNGAAVCNRTLPFYDGKSRVDLAMSHVRSHPARAEGFSGIVHTCRVRYIPVSGHRPWKKNIQFWAANKDIEATFAQIGNAPVYGLFGLDMQTQKGRVRGTASRFESR